MPGVSIGEKVTVVKADTQPAVKVVVAPKIPPGKRVRFGQGVEELFKKGLTNRPLVKGDAIIIPNIALMGGFLPFMVISTQPAVGRGGGRPHRAGRQDRADGGDRDGHHLRHLR